MKFPADPKSRRACTETHWRGCILATTGFITLTIGQGRRIGHVEITCLPAPQCKHRPWLCRSVDERRFGQFAWVWSAALLAPIPANR